MSAAEAEQSLSQLSLHSPPNSSSSYVHQSVSSYNAASTFPRQQVTVSGSSSVPAGHNFPSTSASKGVITQAHESGVSRVNVPKGVYSQTPGSGPRQYAAQDSSTQISTTWEIGPSEQQDTTSGRTFATKRLRGKGGDNDGHGNRPSAAAGNHVRSKNKLHDGG